MSTWTTSKLGDVCEMIKRGIGPKYLEEDGICVINQKCIRDHSVNYDLARRHDVEAKKVNEERYVKAGDVLVNSTGTGTLGRVAQVKLSPTEPTTVDTHVTIVRPKPNFFHDVFFGYMLIKIEEEITSAGEGASGQTELARAKLENEFFVSYPDSIPEQQRIVAILDQAFADIEKARANAEKNLKNARELFDSYLNQVFSQRGEGWVEETFGDVVQTSRGGFSIKSAEYTSSGVPVLTKGDVKPYGGISHGGKYVSNECVELNKWQKSKSGDLIVTTRDLKNTAPFLGIAALVPTDTNYIVNQGATLFKIKESSVFSEFFIFWTCTREYRKQIISRKSGATQVHIRQDDLYSIPFAYPAKTKQKIIAEKLSIMQSRLYLVENIFIQKLASLDELKKSLLQKAFSGELTKSKGIAA